MNKVLRKKKGFTLIELIIVLAIVAIIAAIAIPNFVKVRSESKLKADTQSEETIKRITQTLLAEDKLVPGDTFILKFSDKTTFTIEEVTVTGTLKDKTDELKSYFKEVKKPQQDNNNSYKVETQTKTGEKDDAKTSDEVKVKVTNKE